MATLAFSIAGQFAGGLIGGPIGATIGRALGAIAGSVVDDALFGGEQQPEHIGSDVRLQGSRHGAFISRVYGWNRVSGNIIWATELERLTSRSIGAKGAQKSEEKEQIVANFAVALCEGEVAHLGRIWADGELLDTEGLNIRFYSGSNNQPVDSFILAKQGAGKTPAYRGVCYLVFERLPLEQYGNRIPNISVEICKVAGDLEKSIKAITIIPGATEFGYDPVARVRIVSPGRVVSENANMQGRVSDWTISIDELVALCPNLENVAIVVSWFGDDLRCSNCEIKPKVEGSNRNIKGTEWVVNGINRAQADVVSSVNGGPAYGGTPSDNALLAAIADLKARGLKVTLYPLIMMDIAANNSLNDPYTQAAGQPAYPWRGRITCSPAIGENGTPDKTSAANAQVDNFVGQAQVGHFSASGKTILYSGSADWGYRRMILHYANLMQLAGGVDAFLIGSEMRQMSFVRSSQTQFPFVDALANLAQDVRAVLGADTKISYAADWSEYSGYQPSDASGDKYFHLDKLWANSAIDAIGIDNYMPLSDWRDGGYHADASLANSPHDLKYLQGNIAGGEGYDFYYASEQDRQDQVRSPITDGEHDEPWVWRYKDLHNWWSNAHHNRIGGVRSATATDWVVQSKPFWLTELGCGAVDKGSNLPSAFADPKSDENALPYFSNGAVDPLQQRQHLRAHHLYWQPEADGFENANNPISSVYNDRMLDSSRVYVWTWDARPFPAFPSLTSVWSDGANYASGHWLSGRLGTMGANEFVQAVAADFGVEIKSQISSNVQIEGLQISNITNLRNAIAPILDVADLTILDRFDGLYVTKSKSNSDLSVSSDKQVALNNEIITRTKPDFYDGVGFFTYSYFERKNNYLNATISASSTKGEGVISVNSNLVLNEAHAKHGAQVSLKRLNSLGDVVEFNLPLSNINLEVGDVVDVEGQKDGPFAIVEIRNGDFRKIKARAISGQVSSEKIAEPKFSELIGTPVVGVPEIIVAHLPQGADNNSASRLFIGAFAEPWPSFVSVLDVNTQVQIAKLSQSATMGVITQAIGNFDGLLWDNASQLEVQLFGGHVSSASELAVLATSNKMAIERDDGSWEIIAFVEAELVFEDIYLLTKLLRNLNGSDGNSSVSIGNRVMLLDQNVEIVDVIEEAIGGEIALIAYAGASDSEGVEIIVDLKLDVVLPLAPAHLFSSRDDASDDVEFTWVRRTRVNGNSWAVNEVPLVLKPEAYQLQIFDGVTLLRTINCSSSIAIYSAAEQLADFGSMPNSFNFSIAQISATYGAGHIASSQFSG